MSYLFYFLAGLFAANGVPHFVKGITGEQHMTPFGKPSSPFVNVAWGSGNFFVAAWFFHWALDRSSAFGWASVAVIAGVLLASTGLALWWGRDDKARGK